MQTLTKIKQNKIIIKEKGSKLCSYVQFASLLYGLKTYTFGQDLLQGIIC